MVEVRQWVKLKIGDFAASKAFSSRIKCWKCVYLGLVGIGLGSVEVEYLGCVLFGGWGGRFSLGRGGECSPELEVRSAEAGEASPLWRSDVCKEEGD